MENTFEAQYGTRFGVPVTPAMLDMLTMWPCGDQMTNVDYLSYIYNNVRFLTMFSVSIRGKNS